MRTDRLQAIQLLSRCFCAINRGGAGAPRKLRFSTTLTVQVELDSRGSPTPGGLSAGDGHHLKWGRTHYTKKTPDRATEETGAKTRSSQRPRACGSLSPPPSPPPQLCLLGSLPALRQHGCPRDHLVAPSRLLIFPAHSVVACAWEEPGGAAAGTHVQSRLRRVLRAPPPQGPPQDEGHAAHSPALIPHPYPPRKSNDAGVL